MHAFTRLFHACIIIPERVFHEHGRECHGTSLLLTVVHVVIFMHDEVEVTLVT